MRLHRRNFLKVGAAAGVSGIVQVSQSACGNKGAEDANALDAGGAGSLKIMIRGLSLLEYQEDKHTLVVRMLDATKWGMPAHMPRLAVDATAVDKDANSLAPTNVDQPGTSRERWFWDLSGKTVALLEDTASPDADVDTSTSSGEKPVLGIWKSMKWIPNLKALSGATKVSVDDSYFLCNISLKHGHVQAEEPKGKMGGEVVWTVKKSDGSQVAKQVYSDTLRFTRKLQGRTPVITIDGGKVVLLPGATGEVVFENAAPDPATPPGTAITLGHFLSFFKVVNAAYDTTWTPVPSDLSQCPKCEGDPIFCPPAWI